MDVDTLISLTPTAGRGHKGLYIGSKANTSRDTTWDIPGIRTIRTRGQLRNHLCQLGHRSDGGLCPGCESQCAFGREYSAKYTPDLKQKPHVFVEIVALHPDGSQAHRFPSISAAFRYLGIKKGDCIRNAINRKSPYKGYFWREIEAEEMQE